MPAYEKPAPASPTHKDDDDHGYQTTIHKPKSFALCKDYFAATTIQSAYRAYQAKQKWEALYLSHIQDEILRRKNEFKLRSKLRKKQDVLHTHAEKVQALARGYLIRKEFQMHSQSSSSSDNKNDIGNNMNKNTSSTSKSKRHILEGLSLMETVRKRMDIRKRIELLQEQLSEAKKSSSSSDSEGDDSEEDDDDENMDDEVSVGKVERLKVKQHKLNIKAKTLEAVTRPLHEKLESLRSEHEKLRKKHRKMEAKNESLKTSNEASAEKLEEKLHTIQQTTQDLSTILSSAALESVSRERREVQQRLDALVETSNAYASGSNDRATEVFCRDVIKIGKEAHKEARKLRDQLKHLSRTGSKKFLRSGSTSSFGSVGGGGASTTMGHSSSLRRDLLQDLGQHSNHSHGSTGSGSGRREHGRVLRRLLRDRSRQSLAETELQQSTDRRSASPDPSRLQQQSLITPTKPRRTFSEIRTPTGTQQQPPPRRELRRVLSDRKIPTESPGSAPTPITRNGAGLRRVLSDRKMLEHLQSPGSAPTPVTRNGGLRRVLSDRKISELQSPGSAPTPVRKNGLKRGLSERKGPVVVEGSSSNNNNPRRNGLKRGSSERKMLLPEVASVFRPGLKKVLSQSKMLEQQQQQQQQSTVPSLLRREGLKKVFGLERKSHSLSPTGNSRSSILKSSESGGGGEESGKKPRRKSKDNHAPKKKKSGSSSRSAAAQSQDPTATTPTKWKQPSKSRQLERASGDAVEAQQQKQQQPPVRALARHVSEASGMRKKKEEEGLPPPPRRILSLTNSSDAQQQSTKKNKRSYLRRSKSLTASAQERRRLVEEGLTENLGPTGMIPELE